MEFSNKGKVALAELNPPFLFRVMMLHTCGAVGPEHVQMRIEALSKFRLCQVQKWLFTKPPPRLKTAAARGRLPKRLLICLNAASILLAPDKSAPTPTALPPSLLISRATSSGLAEFLANRTTGYTLANRFAVDHNYIAPSHYIWASWYGRCW